MVNLHWIFLAKNQFLFDLFFFAIRIQLQLQLILKSIFVSLFTADKDKMLKMTLVSVIFYLCVQLLTPLTNADRILGLFIHPGGSHFYSFYPIMNALAENGHNVTVLSYFKVKNPHPSYNQLTIEGEAVINSTLEFKNMVN